MSIFYRFTILLFLGAVAWSAKARSTFVSSHAADLLSPQFNDNIGRGERAVYIVVGARLFRTGHMLTRIVIVFILVQFSCLDRINAQF